jgi:hypothetical protein
LNQPIANQLYAVPKVVSSSLVVTQRAPVIKVPAPNTSMDYLTPQDKLGVYHQPHQTRLQRHGSSIDTAHNIENQLGMAPSSSEESPTLSSSLDGAINYSPSNGKGKEIFFSPDTERDSILSPSVHLSGMSPLSSVAQTSFGMTPVGSNRNNNFLSSPMPDANRKLFQSTSKIDVFQSSNNLSEVTISPIMDVTSMSDTKRAYFSAASYGHKQGICLGIVPLKAAMSDTPFTIVQNTPSNLPIATPSIAGSADPRTTTKKLSLVEKEAPAPLKRHLFDDRPCAKKIRADSTSYV